MPGKMQAPDGWQVVRLGEVATLQRGVDLPIQDRVPGSVPVYGSNGILGTHVQTLHPGPGVITGRSGSIGVVYFSTGPYWPLNTTLYVRDFHGNSERFIYYLLSQLKLERFAASTGVPSLNRNFVHPEPVPLPPLPEQRAIAAVLDSIDDAIEHTEAVITATERLRDALLHELLTCGVPGWHTEWKVRQLTIVCPSRAEQDYIAAALDGLDEAIEQARRERNGLQSLKASAADALLTGHVRVKVS